MENFTNICTSSVHSVKLIEMDFKYCYSVVCAQYSLNGNLGEQRIALIVTETQSIRMATPIFSLHKLFTACESLI